MIKIKQKCFLPLANVAKGRKSLAKFETIVDWKNCENARSFSILH
jgi:hypothetical protein